MQEERPVSISQALEEASQALRSKRAKLVRVTAKPRSRGASTAAEHAAAPADDSAPGSAPEAAAMGASRDQEPESSELHPSGAAAEDGGADDLDDLELQLMAHLDGAPAPDAHGSPCGAGAAAGPEPGGPDTSAPSAAAGKKRRWSASRKQQRSKQRKAAALAETDEALPPDTAGQADDGVACSAEGLALPADPAVGHETLDNPLKKSPQRQKRVRQTLQRAEQPTKKWKGRRSDGPEQQGSAQDVGSKAGGALSLAELEQLTAEVMNSNEQATAGGK